MLRFSIDHVFQCVVCRAGVNIAALENLKTTPVGFEPTRGDPIGLAGRRLNRSAKVSLVCSALESIRLALPGCRVSGAWAELLHRAVQQEMRAQCRNGDCECGLRLSD